MWRQTSIHYFLHLIFPVCIALVFFRKDWKTVYFLLLTTMLIDLDHLFADPIFQASRCSVNFHVLHSNYAVLVYMLLLFLKRPFRIIGIGLLFHIFTDLIDCILSYITSNPNNKEYTVSELIKYVFEIFS